MVETTFENKDALSGMEIYPGGRGGHIDLSDDAIKKIEDGLAISSAPKPVLHSKLFEQLDPQDRVEAEKPIGEFNSGTPRPTELAVDSSPIKLERNSTDVQLEDMALQAFYDGRTDLTIKYFSEIKDREAVREQIETIVEKLVTLKEYEDALKLSNLIFDEASREMEVRHIKSEQAKNSPTSNGELEEDDHVENEEGRRVNINIVRKPEPEADLPGLNSESVPPQEKFFPTAIELAMQETNRFVETKAPITPPESPTTSETLSPDVPNDTEARDSIEANLEALRSAREKYATAYTEWEYKTQNSTKLWQKTMFALGAVKPAPERLTLRTTELEDAREVYLKAREVCGKKTSRTYKENYERAQEEKLLLEEAIQQSRQNRENSDEQNRQLSEELNQKSSYDKFTERLGRAKNFWVKDLTPGKRVLISSTLLAGGTLFAGAGLGGAAVIGGLRVARAGAGILGAQMTGLGLGKYFENKNDTNEELDLKEYAGSIDETNFAEVEAKRLQAFENSLNTKRRQNTAKIGAIAAVGGATVLTSGAYFSSVADASTENVLDKSPTEEVPVKVAVKAVSQEDLSMMDGKTDLISVDLVQEIHSLKADILSHYHDGVVPEAIKKNILDVPTDKLLEQFHLVDTEHNASAGSVAGGRILFENGKVVYEKGGISRGLYDPNIELVPGTVNGTEVLSGDPVTTPDELKVSEPALGVTEVKGQEPVIVDENKMNLTPEAGKDFQTPLPSGRESGFALVGGNQTMMFNGQPISHIEDGATGKIPVLDDKYQDGREYANIRTAFAEEFNKVVSGKSMGTNKFSPFQESFEGGKISILYGTPADPNHLSMVLNGKEIATGSVEAGVPKFTMHSELKGGLFTDTVYERAFKVMGKKIKAKAFEF